MQAKPFYASKTMWANLIGGAVTIGSVFGLDLGLDAAAQAQLVAGIMVVVNLVLRLVTKSKIGKPNPPGSLLPVLLLFVFVA